MADVLMFAIADPSSGSGASSGNQGKSVQPTTTCSAFDISPAVWSQLGQLVGQAGAAAPTIAGFPAPNSHHPHLGALRSAWDPFAAQIGGWNGQIAPALKAVAADIVSFGQSVAPSGYGALIAMLKAMGANPLTAAQAKSCADTLSGMAAQASARAQAAGQAAAKFGPLIQALAALQASFGLVPRRNPPVKVMLPQIPGVCLSYGDDGLACGGDANGTSPRNLWQVYPVPPGMEWYFVANDGRVLAIQLDGHDSPTRYQHFDQTARPGLIAASAAMQGDEPRPIATFKIPPPEQGGLIHNQRYPRYALDCAGNSGWGAGTAILNFVVNNGVNQHWRVEPPPWDMAELDLYDLVAPIAGNSLAVSALERIEGDWRAVADDLGKAVAKAQASVNTTIPILGALQVQNIVTAWGGLAQEAAAAAQGL